MKEKKIKKKDFYLVESGQTIAFVLSYCNLHLFHYFLFYIIIYIIFTIYDTFHSILFLNDARDTQILLFMSYKLACYQSQKIISNIYSLYFLSNINHIITPSVYKFFSSYELVIFV